MLRGGNGDIPSNAHNLKEWRLARFIGRIDVGSALRTIRVAAEKRETLGAAPGDRAMRERPRHSIEDFRVFGIDIDREETAKPQAKVMSAAAMDRPLPQFVFCGQSLAKVGPSFDCGLPVIITDDARKWAVSEFEEAGRTCCKDGKATAAI